MSIVVDYMSKGLECRYGMYKVMDYFYMSLVKMDYL